MQQRLGRTQKDLDDTKDPSKYQFFKIVVASWYAFGKFGQPNGAKYELKWNGGNRLF